MRFWDSSAIIPLLVKESETAVCTGLFREDSEVAVWWGTEIECMSALIRRERAADLSSVGAAQAAGRLAALSVAWTEALPSEEIRALAVRFLRLHALRAADATQLSAAYVLSGESPAALEFVCLDERLRVAAEREGFSVLPA
ncbi:MAG: type II toxin-antitoxin system VapC family toxin [Gemmatimonadaceae bacterium]|nr:type II toxin-antitoxin system VapC family toxin [Gemmatimonadaceae bacterium]